MDGNKDEALRCLRIAEQAIASGNKERALKFIKISHRLNPKLPVCELLDACGKLGSASPKSSVGKARSANTAENGLGSAGSHETLNGERSYTEEQVELISRIRRNRDYYAILGVEKACSVEEIRKAYRKLSLKVHPDKSKAPGSEEAFKKVSKAFKCLSDGDSRRQYDQVGLVEEFEHSAQNNVRKRGRNRTGHEFFNDDCDPDEIFRAFFGQGDLFRASRAYRTRGMGSHRREESDTARFSFMVILQILPFFIILLLAYLPFMEPEYTLFKNYPYQIPKTTENHGVEFFVKSSGFDVRYPPGSTARANFEDNVIKDYKSMLWRYCHVEMQRRRWNKKLPTPNCDKLQNLGVS